MREASNHPAPSKSDIETIYSLTDQHSLPVNPERFIRRFNLIFSSIWPVLMCVPQR